MCIWITTSGFSRLFLRYDIHLDDSLQIDEQVANDSVANSLSLYTSGSSSTVKQPKVTIAFG